MRRLSPVLLMLFVSLMMFSVNAQETTPEPAPEFTADALTAQNVRITAERNVFDEIELMAVGEIVNMTPDAHTSIDIFADVLDVSGEVIGEGFGFPVDACGTGLVFDFALQPGDTQQFSLALEIFETDADPDDVEIFIESNITEPLIDNTPETFTGITQASDQEVVQIEWLGEGNLLRYGVGCDNDVFTALEWFQYNAIRGNSTVVIHPDAELITQPLLDQLGLTDASAFANSQLTFSPTSRRLLHQTDINVIISAEPDGSFRRLIWDDLSRHTLQGFIWLPEGRFLAYYFGATGDEVRYFTASVDGQRISGSIYNVLRSQTIPGPTPDGVRAVIGTTIDDITGFYLNNTVVNATELLFETDLPGNNYPAPLYVPIDNGAQIYFVLPVDDSPHLQCFDTTTGQLNDITALPLQLDDGSRSWMQLSPDGTDMALSSNGVNGGLWILDLATFGGCTPQLAG